MAVRSVTLENGMTVDLNDYDYMAMLGNRKLRQVPITGVRRPRIGARSRVSGRIGEQMLLFNRTDAPGTVQVPISLLEKYEGYIVYTSENFGLVYGTGTGNLSGRSGWRVDIPKGTISHFPVAPGPTPGPTYVDTTFVMKNVGGSPITISANWMKAMAEAKKTYGYSKDLSTLYATEDVMGASGSYYKLDFGGRTYELISKQTPGPTPGPTPEPEPTPGPGPTPGPTMDTKNYTRSEIEKNGWQNITPQSIGFKYYKSSQTWEKDYKMKSGYMVRLVIDESLIPEWENYKMDYLPIIAVGALGIGAIAFFILSRRR